MACEGLFIAARTFDPAAGASWETWRARKVKGQLFDLIRQERYIHGDTDVSLELIVDADALTLGDSLPSPEPPVSPEDSIMLRAAMASLGPKDRLVLRLFFEDDRTLTEIGAAVGVGTSRAFQLKQAALKAIRAAAS